MLVRLLEFGETLPKYGQVATGSHGVGVSNPKDAPHPLHRLIEEFLGKYQIVSRGSSTLQDRIRVTVSKPEAYIVVGAILSVLIDSFLEIALLQRHLPA